jgi:hypothetical protein
MKTLLEKQEEQAEKKPKKSFFGKVKVAIKKKGKKKK